MYFSKNLTGRSALAKRGVELLVRRYASFAVLLMMLLFAGCEEEPEQQEVENSSFIPVGEWTAKWDSYIITKTSIEYDGYGPFKGDIEKAIDFSNDAGVLIIKITASSGDFTVGKYTGIYYSAYTSTSIKLANVWLEGSDGNWYPLETDSLSAAESLFTVDNVGTYVDWSVQSGYTK